VATLALQRRLVEERAERERLEDELRGAREQISLLSAHQDTALERSREVVRLEGELAMARDEIARLRAGEPVEPLPRRIPTRRRSQQWGTGTRVAGIAVVLVVLGFFALILAILI
jgi:hypothetical protein